MFWNFKGFKKGRCVLNPAKPALKNAVNAVNEKHLIFQTGKNTRFFGISAVNAVNAGCFLLIVRKDFLIMPITTQLP